MREIISNFDLVTNLNNSVSAKLLTTDEWLMIIRDVLEKCGKFLKSAYERNDNFNYRHPPKSLSDYLFNHSVFKDGCEKRMPCPELERNIDHNCCLVDINTPCIFAEKVKSICVDEITSETWVLLTLEGKLLFAELNFCKQSKKEKWRTFKYDEVVFAVSLHLDTPFNSDVKEYDFSEIIVPYINPQFAKNILHTALGILEFDYMRREREAKEFGKAFAFRKMVLARIDFPNK